MTCYNHCWCATFSSQRRSGLRVPRVRHYRFRNSLQASVGCRRTRYCCEYLTQASKKANQMMASRTCVQSPGPPVGWPCSVNVRVKILDVHKHHCLLDLGPYRFETMPCAGDQITLIDHDTILSFEVIRLEHQPHGQKMTGDESKQEGRRRERTSVLVSPSIRRTTAQV